MQICGALLQPSVLSSSEIIIDYPKLRDFLAPRQTDEGHVISMERTQAACGAQQVTYHQRYCKLNAKKKRNSKGS